MLSKLLERLVLSRLLTNLNNNALLAKTVSISSAPLHGNCCPESCVWHQGGTGCWSRLLLHDMSAAFDTADHDILIARFDKTFALRQTPQWFRAYLSGSSQMIVSSSSRNFKQRIRRATGLCTGINSLLPVCFRHCGYSCHPWSLQPQVCRWHPDLRPLQPWGRSGSCLSSVDLFQRDRLVDVF